MTCVELIQSGLALVPIPLGEKGPKTPNWNLLENCVNKTSQSHLLEGLNIGLAHAYSTPTPTVAIDIDNYKHAKIWLATHNIEVAELLKTNDAVVIWSGKKYSMKLIYRLSTGVPALESKKIVGPDGHSVIEFRCATKDGKTVQDVLPPSIHPEGHQYQWMGNGDPLCIPDIPQSLLTIWKILIDKGSRVALRRNATSLISHQRLETNRQIAIISEALNHISADCDYEKWRNIVWAILSTGWLCAETIALEWSQTTPHRFEDDAYWVLANSYIPDHPNQITVGSIYHHARIGGWNG